MEPSIDKVISGLEHCIPDPNKSLHERTEENECRHAECPYGGKEYQYGMGCFWSLMSDALALLKEQSKTGRWIYCEDASGQDGYKCSECGFFEPWYYNFENIDFIKDYEHCPSCNARMENR